MTKRTRGILTIIGFIAYFTAMALHSSAANAADKYRERSAGGKQLVNIPWTPPTGYRCEVHRRTDKWGTFYYIIPRDCEKMPDPLVVTDQHERDLQKIIDSWLKE